MKLLLLLAALPLLASATVTCQVAQNDVTVRRCPCRNLCPCSSCATTTYNEGTVVHLGCFCAPGDDEDIYFYKDASDWFINGQYLDHSSCSPGTLGECSGCPSNC